MNGCSTRTERDNLLVLATQLLQVPLKGVHIGAKRHYPVGVKSLLDILHLLATHVGET